MPGIEKEYVTVAKKEKERQEQKKKVEDFGKELKEFSDEQLDQVAGGSLSSTYLCAMANCTYDLLTGCVCDFD